MWIPATCRAQVTPVVCAGGEDLQQGAGDPARRDHVIMPTAAAPAAAVEEVVNGTSNSGGAAEGASSRPAPSQELSYLLVLELEVPYERRELSYRMQWDHWMLSSIPTIATIFDHRGWVVSWRLAVYLIDHLCCWRSVHATSVQAAFSVCLAQGVNAGHLQDRGE